MYDEQHFTRDSATAVFKETDGITVDDDGEPSIEWDDVTVERIEDPPHADAFDSKRFYVLPATVARPIRQGYNYGEDTVHLKKPRAELKQAAWSLDNAPWTMDHPDTGMVKNVDDIRGFWGDPAYYDSSDDLDAKLHVPVGDQEVKSFITENSDVSVGFYNKVEAVENYDSAVGGADDDVEDLDGVQTDIYFDHVASVSTGRCPGEKGCGIEDAHGHMSDSLLSGTEITGKSEQDTQMQETADQPSGIKTDGGTWFAVGPGEHTKDSTDHPGDHMFPVDSCSDVEDAWNLRGSAEDLKISESTLSERIVRAAEAKDCTGMPSTLQEQMDYATADSCGCGGGEDCTCSGDCGDNETTDTLKEMEFNIDFEDLTPEAILAKVEEKSDSVQEHLDELRSYEDKAEVAEEAAEELELDSTDDLADSVSMLDERNGELEEKITELQRPQMEEDAEFIAEHTERFGEDAEEVLDELDKDPEALSSKRELVEDLADVSTATEKTANPLSDSEDEKDEESVRKNQYAVSPWE